MKENNKVLLGCSPSFFDVILKKINDFDQEIQEEVITPLETLNSPSQNLDLNLLLENLGEIKNKRKSRTPKNNQLTPNLKNLASPSYCKISLTPRYKRSESNKEITKASKDRFGSGKNRTKKIIINLNEKYTKGEEEDSLLIDINLLETLKNPPGLNSSSPGKVYLPKNDSSNKQENPSLSPVKSFSSDLLFYDDEEVQPKRNKKKSKLFKKKEIRNKINPSFDFNYKFSQLLYHDLVKLGEEIINKQSSCPLEISCYSLYMETLSDEKIANQEKEYLTRWISFEKKMISAKNNSLFRDQERKLIEDEISVFYYFSLSNTITRLNSQKLEEELDKVLRKEGQRFLEKDSQTYLSVISEKEEESSSTIQVTTETQEKIKMKTVMQPTGKLFEVFSSRESNQSLVTTEQKINKDNLNRVFNVNHAINTDFKNQVDSSSPFKNSGKININFKNHVKTKTYNDTPSVRNNIQDSNRASSKEALEKLIKASPDTSKSYYDINPLSSSENDNSSPLDPKENKLETFYSKMKEMKNNCNQDLISSRGSTIILDKGDKAQSDTFSSTTPVEEFNKESIINPSHQHILKEVRNKIFDSEQKKTFSENLEEIKDSDKRYPKNFSNPVNCFNPYKRKVILEKKEEKKEEKKSLAL